jgi:amino acid transporter
MVSQSFGSYARGLFLPDDSSEAWVKVFATIAVIAMALVYVLGAEAVGRLQSIVVMILLAVFVVFIIATFSEIDLDLLAPSTYPSAADIVAAVALTFFAYLGFAVVATTAESIADPATSVPRATYLALVIAGGLYVLISLGVYGTLTVDEVIASGDTALAEAAEPALGQAGYTMMAIAALLATGSSINANLFAAGNLTASLAKTHEFPPVFGQRVRLLGTAGVVITVGLVLGMALLLDLSTIASVGSAVALVIFALVGIAGIKLRHDTASNLVVLLAAVAATLVVLVLFGIDTARNEPRTFLAILVVGVIAVALDTMWRARRDRDAASTPNPAAS